MGIRSTLVGNWWSGFWNTSGTRRRLNIYWCSKANGQNASRVIMPFPNAPHGNRNRSWTRPFSILYRRLNEFSREAPEEALHDVTREEYSIEEQRAFLLDRLAGEKNLSFSALVENRPRPFIVATFLGVLELVQVQQVRVHISEGDPIDFYLELCIRQGKEVSEDLDRTDESDRRGRRRTSR